MLDAALLDLIYEAAAVPELWPAVLKQIAEYAESWGVGLISFDPAQRMRFIATPNYEDVFVNFAARGSTYDNKRPRHALATGHSGFTHDLELFTQAELDDDPVYRDFIYPAGVKWTAGLVLPVPTQDILIFDVSRKESHGAFDRPTMALLDEYRPHLARAALLSHRLGLRAARAATQALQTIGVPAAMLDESGRTLSANADLEALAPRIVAGAFDRLQIGQRNQDTLLRTALSELQSGRTAVSSIPMPASGDDPALIVHVLPIRGAASDIFTRAAALVVVTPVTAPTSPLSEVLTGLFDLSPAEARVAKGIGNGLSIEDIATSHRLSKETVRSQLKAVLAKTGTSRQVDLARLLSGTGALPVSEGFVARTNAIGYHPPKRR